MLMKDKVAVIYGAAGAIGGTVARTFAREGAKLYLSGRKLSPVKALAEEIVKAGGRAEAETVDALDEDAIERYSADVFDREGRIDAVLNAISFDVVQGVSLVDVKREDFVAPIATWTTTQFLTARAAARHMIKRRSGVVLTLSASPARLALALTSGFGVACAAVEGLTRTLAAELGPHGVRAVCIRPHRIGDTLGAEADFPMGREQFKELIEGWTLLKRLPSLADVATTAAFLASDGAASITGTVTNLTCGMSAD